MSQNPISAPHALGVTRLPVDKPQAAVDFLHARGGGVMDLIAHFWDRLPQTPPLARHDLHLVITLPESDDDNTNIHMLNTKHASLVTGAMLYVPKAHRADVLATDAAAARALAAYIARVGGNDVPPTHSIHDDATKKSVAIDFLTGEALGIRAMIPHLLPLVHKRVPARQTVNHVMQLPPHAPTHADTHVRIARDGDMPVLNRWRNAYKQERGILFDADVDAWVNSGKVFLYESNHAPVALAKFDLDLASLVEIGGVYTFPEHRRQGYGGKLVTDLAHRVRAAGKIPMLQVDTENDPALHLYQNLGWSNMGQLARVWLTG